VRYRRLRWPGLGPRDDEAPASRSAAKLAGRSVAPSQILHGSRRTLVGRYLRIARDPERHACVRPNRRQVAAAEVPHRNATRLRSPWSCLGRSRGGELAWASFGRMRLLRKDEASMRGNRIALGYRRARSRTVVHGPSVAHDSDTGLRASSLPNLHCDCQQRTGAFWLVRPVRVLEPARPFTPLRLGGSWGYAPGAPQL
jgi:hypothetical protein